MIPAKRTLVRKLHLLEDETVVSFFQRHCAANVISRPRDLLRLLEEECVPFTTISSAQNIVETNAALKALASITGHPAEPILERRLIVLTGASGMQVRQGHHEWPLDARKGKYQALCPLCLKDNRYARLQWEFVQAPVCTRHKVVLLEDCTDCNVPIKPQRASVVNCEACISTFDAQVSSGASEAAVKAAALVQRPQTLALGRQDSTSPIDVDELSKLLRLCVIPRPGESLGYGLTDKLSSLPTERRVAALEVFGRAIISGRSIDSELLREGVMARWPFAKHIPRSEQVRLVKNACSTLELPQDVARLLCYGADTPPEQTAVEVYGVHPPTLTNRSMLAEHLGISPSQLGDLERFVPVAPEASGYGYDMDDVLKLRHAHEACLSTDAVDEMLGLRGVTEELIKLKIFWTVRASGGESLVHPSVLTELLGLLHERVDLRTSASTISLSFAVEMMNLDASDVARAVAQVIGGSLTVGRWEAPSRLVDLCVDEQRLATLRR